MEMVFQGSPLSSALFHLPAASQSFCKGESEHESSLSPAEASSILHNKVHVPLKSQQSFVTI